MPGGECTITLQDVAIQFGLPVDGQPVTGSLEYNWEQVCGDFLGVRPTELKGSRLSIPWLAAQFTELPLDVDDITIKRYARAYIMQLIGGFLFADKSNTFVHLMFLPLLDDFEEAGKYSWGGACLAWLYKELCRASHATSLEIAGPLILLQVWAFDRFCTIAPKHELKIPDHYGRPLSNRWCGISIASEQSSNMLIQYRIIFDRLHNQINWTPYTPDIMAILPDYCHNGQDIWLTVSPLICFHIVEWHQPNRVLRQFSMRQPVPPYCDTNTKLHQLDLRSKHDHDWPQHHAKFISLWHARRDHCAQGCIVDKPAVSDDYVIWYDSITRRYITPEGAYYAYTNNFVRKVRQYSVEHNLPILESMCDQYNVDITKIIEETRRLNVADMDRRRVRRRRQKQVAKDILEPQVD